MPRLFTACLYGLSFCALPATAAKAAVVTFTGTVLNSCVLSVTTPGLLTTSNAGTTLGSEEAGGVNAIMSVIATGSTPTITFAAPTLTGPSASTADATKEVGFNAQSGTSQGYAPSPLSYPLSRLTDTVTVKGRVTNPNGFVSGTYGLSMVVTCQQ